MLSLSAAMLTGCAPLLSPQVDERLTQLPIRPHTNEVEVLFSGEWPKEEYVKVAALEARGGENTPYINLIKSLQAKARAYGADAVVVQGKNFTADVYTSVITGRVNTDGTSTLPGIAIKYKKNLETSLMPKHQYIEAYNPIAATYEPMLALQLSPTGEIKEKEQWHEDAVALYNNVIYSYSLRHLLEPGSGWKEHQQEGYVTERQLHKGGLLLKRIIFEYNKERQLQRIQIYRPNGFSEEISYTYDLVGRLVKRDITREKLPYLTEEYTYDDKGQATEVEIFHASTPELIPFMRSRFTYYTLEEI